MMDPVIKFKQDLGGWSAKFSKESRKQRHPLPKFIGESAIDYDALKWLCSVEGLGERDRPSTSDAHVSFMSNYAKMFSSLKPHQQVAASLHLPNQRKLTFAEGEITKAQQYKIPHDKGLFPHWCQGFNPPLSHNISDHLSKLHRQSAVTRSPAGLQHMRLKAVRRMLKKLPFERKSRENEMLFRHVQHFPALTEQVPSRVLLKELCSVAQLDKCPEEDYPVFGGTGLHLILRGSVTLQTSSAILPVSEKTKSSFSPATPITDEGDLSVADGKLTVGQCFGTLSRVEGKELNPRFLSVTTLEPCEFLKISTNDYAQVIQIIDAREEDEKLSLAKTCKLFHSWPLLSLKKIAALIKWREFAPGQVLVSEGERCEVIGFIKKGHCLLRRCITVAHTFPNGKKEKRAKSVMIGKLVPGGSFGETTVLKGLPMPCSVITASRVEMGTISSLDVYDLDEVTRSLLTQSYSVMDVTLTEEEIQKEYIEQEKAKEWMRVKNPEYMRQIVDGRQFIASKVVSDVIYYRGILPGYSKWSRNPSSLQTPGQ